MSAEAEPPPHAQLGPPGRALAGGELNAAIARAVVKISRSVGGRGPTKARAFHRDNVFVIVMEETQSRAEKSLIATDQGAAVLRLRSELQTAMRDQLVANVEKLTGCHVTAFLSSTHIAPDISVQVFVLDHSLADGCQDPAEAARRPKGKAALSGIRCDRRFSAPGIGETDRKSRQSLR